MNFIDVIQSEKVKSKNEKIILEVALYLNKELFDENIISYKIYKYTEQNILKELRKYNV